MPEDAKYCGVCGKPLVAPAQTATATSPLPLLSKEDFSGLRKNVELRAKTDVMLSTSWILLPVISYILNGIFIFLFISLASLGLFSGVESAAPFSLRPTVIGVPRQPPIRPFIPGLSSAVSGLFLTSILAGVIAAILYLVLVYRLLNRRNQHFNRHELLDMELLGAVWAIVEGKGVAHRDRYNSLLHDVRAASVWEKEKPAFLWALLILIPYIGIISLLYVLYSLTRDFQAHERRESTLLANVKNLLPPDVPLTIARRTKPLRQRNFWLYLVLSIVTLGFFTLYWFYILIKEPNTHFAEHKNWEDQLLSSLDSLSGPRLP